MAQPKQRSTFDIWTIKEFCKGDSEGFFTRGKASKGGDELATHMVFTGWEQDHASSHFLSGRDAKAKLATASGRSKVILYK